MSALALNHSRAVRAQQGLMRIAAAAAPSGSVKARVLKAHELTHLPYSRTRELWYGRARRVEDAELAAIESALPPDTVEFSLAYVRSVENRVAALLDELVAVRSRYEAGLAGRRATAADASRSAGAGGERQSRGANPARGGGNAADRP